MVPVAPESKTEGKEEPAGDQNVPTHGAETRKWATALNACGMGDFIVGPKWNGCHVSNYPLSCYHLHRLRDDMGLRDLLSPSRKGRRARSKARSDADAVEGSNEVSLAISHPAESDTDLGTGPSTLQTSVPPSPKLRESGGMWMTLSRAPRITVFSRYY